MNLRNFLLFAALFFGGGAIAAVGAQPAPVAAAPAAAAARPAQPVSLTLPPLPLPPVLPPVLPSSNTPLSLDAQFPYGVPLTEFARVVIGDTLRGQYIFSPEFLSSTDRVAFTSAGLKAADSLELLRSLLKERGFSIEKAGAYYRVSPVSLEAAKAKPLVTHFYKLKHRKLDYITSVLAPLLPSGAITSQRATPPVASTTGATPSLLGASTPASTQAKPADNGATPYSYVTRGDLDVLLLRATQEDLDRVVPLIEQLDTPVSRLMVHALVIETQSSDTQAFALNAVLGALKANVRLELTGGPAQPQALTFKGPDFSVILSALKTDSRFRLLTTQAVPAENCTPATLTVGQSVPTLGAIQQNGNGQSTQSVQYQDTGAILTVTPCALSESISVTVSQQISDAIPTTTGVTGTATITKRQLTATVPTVSGEWVLMGGLKGSKISGSTQRLPFLGWPIGESVDNSSTDIVLLLQVERVPYSS